MRAVPASQTRGGFTLVDLLVVLTLVAVVATLATSVLGRAARQDRIQACADHLGRIHQAAQAQDLASPPAPPALGKSYWVRLLRTHPPQVAPDLLRCPLRNPAVPAEGECDYLGPSRDVQGLQGEDPVGCDEITNHHPLGREGGHVLLNDGRVLLLRAEPLRTLHQGKCRP